MRLSSRYFHFLRVLTLFASIVSCANLLVAQSAEQPASAWIEAVRSLAMRIASFTPLSEPVYLDFRNLSSVDAGEASAVLREVSEELGRRGLHLSSDPGATAHVEVTLSQSAEGYLLVGRVRRTEGEQVA